ncbi:YeeE/YedE family protein [Bradyrhizobium sp.]|uniref:YeeE/YedE family protein n=1 Tax=Bradyrhizobium sp. TaxID=376 RepID=UPI002D739F98|nr:YeeE/YedE thiosulfate transporter family protein [Bradyrhizobium sp.]HZR73726.1 YeeE/YedE thiosulfate transporter family protein [Bradyrhizobium sp.]
MHHFTPLSGLIGGALIGLASALLMLSAGRLAGVSGMLGGSLTANSDRGWRLAFIAGLIAAALIGPLFGTPGAARLSSSNLVLYAAAGLLVGFGSRMGNGCTSGHGVCGFARISTRSIVATLVFMGVAFITVAVVRHGVGG